MTNLESTTFIIVGLTKEGRKFRPSDWAERLCGVMSAFGAERKMKYSPYVGPGDYQRRKSRLRRWPPRRTGTHGLPLHAQLRPGERPADR